MSTQKEKKRELGKRYWLTGQDDSDGHNHTDCIIKLSHESTDDTASKEQQNQGVLVDLLGKLEIQWV